MYIRSLSQISRSNPDPDYRSMFSVMEARRLSLLMKRAIAVSKQALAEAGVAVPDAVITGTGLGCIDNTERFLKSLTGLSDAPLRPTNFMQSTHNTIGSLIAITLGCHGYNATYSHGAISFESALFDAFLQIGAGEIENALVGAFEEMTPDFAAMLAKTGWDGVTRPEDLSETAVSLLLTASPEDALCRIDDIVISNNPAEGPAFDDRTKVIDRASCVAAYGDNFCVSAHGLCDAVRALAAGGCGRAAVVNSFSGKYRATITLSSLCGE